MILFFHKNVSSKLPKEKIDAFLNVLGKLKQRVIWKFEDESYEVPSNVLIKKWLPQSDILGHPNVVLFITHGGKNCFQYPAPTCLLNH